MSTGEEPCHLLVTAEQNRIIMKNQGRCIRWRHVNIKRCCHRWEKKCEINSTFLQSRKVYSWFATLRTNITLSHKTVFLAHQYSFFCVEFLHGMFIIYALGVF